LYGSSSTSTHAHQTHPPTRTPSTPPPPLSSAGAAPNPLHPPPTQHHAPPTPPPTSPHSNPHPPPPPPTAAPQTALAGRSRGEGAAGTVAGRGGDGGARGWGVGREGERVEGVALARGGVGGLRCEWCTGQMLRHTFAPHAPLPAHPTHPLALAPPLNLPTPPTECRDLQGEGIKGAGNGRALAATARRGTYPRRPWRRSSPCPSGRRAPSAREEGKGKGGFGGEWGVCGRGRVVRHVPSLGRC
jgi:hypothetical protein